MDRFLYVTAILMGCVKAGSAVATQNQGFTAEPSVVVPGLTQSLKLRCSLHAGVAVAIDTLLVMQIEREEAGSYISLITLVPGTTATLETASWTGRANISQYFSQSNISETMLEVTLSQPMAEDTGKYVCAISTLDKRHLLTKYELQANVTYQPLTSVGTVTLASALTQTLTRLDDMERQLQALIQDKRVLEQKVADFENCSSAQCTSGFSPSQGQQNGGLLSHDNGTCLQLTKQDQNCVDLALSNVTSRFQILVSGLEARVSSLETGAAFSLSSQPVSSKQTPSVSTSMAPSSTIKTATSATGSSKLPSTAATSLTGIAPSSNPAYRVMSPDQDIYLRELPNQPIIAPFDIPLTPGSGRLVNYSVQICLGQESLSEADKVALESYKVSGTTFQEWFGICLGQISNIGSGSLPPDPAGTIIGKRDKQGRRSRRSSFNVYTPCTCQSHMSLYAEPEIFNQIARTEFTLVPGDLHVCLTSLWTNPVTRSHVYMHPQCTKIEAWA